MLTLVYRAGDTLLRRLVLAIPQSILHRHAFQTFTEGLREEHEQQLVDWDRMVKLWEIDNSNPNPYAYPVNSKHFSSVSQLLAHAHCIYLAVTVNNIKRQLAEEEHRVIESGAVPLALSSSNFIVSGLAIEEAQ